MLIAGLLSSQPMGKRDTSDKREERSTKSATNRHVKWERRPVKLETSDQRGTAKAKSLNFFAFVRSNFPRRTAPPI
ncbi:hypothetical protein ACOMHN_017396 [Nucella lapillus]